MNFPIIPLLMGPTASGKSDLAEALAEFFPLEIINVDSALVYREMNIGTAKPSLLQRAAIPHHLIDIRDPAQTYSAADFCQDVMALIPSILERQRFPLLVGGTMMYFKSLISGLSTLPKADPLIREQLTAEAEKKGWEKLHQQLAQIDPETAQRLHPHDAQRIQRALEVYLITKTPLSILQKEQKKNFPYSYRCLVVAPADRKILHQRIASRFEKMLQQGFVEEVKSLMQRADLNLNMPALRAVGYRQMWQGLENHLSIEEITQQCIAATRQLAKRQLTWLRQWPDCQWFDSTISTCLSELKTALAVLLRT